MAAVREIESLTLDRTTLHYKQKLALDYAEMVYNGLWFTPLREALDAFFAKVSEPVTGEVTMRLYKGNLQPVSRKSPNSLYNLDIASFTMGASYDQKDALGFINLIGLPIKVEALLEEQVARHETVGRQIRGGPFGGLRDLLGLAALRSQADLRRCRGLAGVCACIARPGHPDGRRMRNS